MRFDDFAGKISIDTSHMQEFMRSWFRENDLVTIMGTTASGHRSNLSFTIPVQELVQATPDEFEKLTVVESDGRRVNLYFGVNPTKEDNSVSLYKRGGKENVREIYGCFIDFDVVHTGSKEGVFSSKENIYNFLNGLTYPPTIIVDNGVNGGVHAYWRLLDEDVSRADETLIAHWWAYISSLSDVKIDRLIDKSRVARMPSGIYWPKDGDKFDTVKVIKSDGNRYKLDDLMSISKQPFDDYNYRMAEIRAQKTRVDVDKWNAWLLDKVKEKNPNSSRTLCERQVLVLMHMLDNHMNTQYSWHDILEPYGWTYLRTHESGAGVWARPGQNARSAEVDFVKPDGTVSPVMSLLSSSEETGLSDLKEAGVPLTKRQVLLRLKYNDDVIAMVNDMYSEVIHD